MARRRKNRAGFGFMMFQDIIMAVFGILILIVLYLMFNVRTESIAMEKELGEEIEQIQEENSERRGRINLMASELAAKADAASKDRLLSDRRLVLEEIRGRIATVKRAVDEVRERISQGEERIAEMLAGFEDHQVVRRAVVRVMEKERELDLAERRLRELEEVYANFEAALEKGPIFRPSAEFAAFDNVFFIELSGDRRAFYELRDDRIAEITDESEKKAAQDAIVRYPRETRVMIFVRPTGVPVFREMKRSFRSAGVAFGYEPLPEGEPFRLVDLDYDPQSHERGRSGNGESLGGGRGGSGSAGGPEVGDGTGAEEEPVPSGGNVEDEEAGEAKAGEGVETGEVEEPETTEDEESAEAENPGIDWNLALLFILVLLAILLALGILSWRSKRPTGGIR